MNWWGSHAKHYTWTNAMKKTVPIRWGDGICDEFLNNKFYQYDGGDCCVPKASQQRFMNWRDYSAYHNYQSYEDEKYMASNLVCHEDEQPLRSFTDFYANPTCSYVFKDGICDDWANTEECFFDGGDCCLTKINSIRCTECVCKYEDSRHVSYKGQ